MLVYKKAKPVVKQGRKVTGLNESRIAIKKINKLEGGEMKKTILTGFATSLLLLFEVIGMANAVPIMDQTGNLIVNGNFESGTNADWHTNSDGTYLISNVYAYDGSYSTLIDTHNSGTDSFGNWASGLWQYTDVLAAEYTVSAWVLPTQGQAYIGLQWFYLPTPVGQVFSSPTTSLNQWIFIETTGYIDQATEGGPLLYGLSDQDIFYVDCVWMNQGSVNLSPYAPGPVPEPSSILLFGLGILGLAGISRKKPTQMKDESDNITIKKLKTYNCPHCGKIIEKYCYFC